MQKLLSNFAFLMSFIIIFLHFYKICKSIFIHFDKTYRPKIIILFNLLFNLKNMLCFSKTYLVNFLFFALIMHLESQMYICHGFCHKCPTALKFLQTCLETSSALMGKCVGAHEVGPAADMVRMGHWFQI